MTRWSRCRVLAKSIKRGALDEDLTSDDQKRMLVFLRKYVTYPRITFTRGLHVGYKFYLARATNAACRVILWTCRALLDANLWTACFLKHV